ncbi:MAG: hypothetical protein K2F63_05335, partial [Muribaculaceae bacterium]|nr:hypothetical protein [Muribaculaceae bacterium]
MKKNIVMALSVLAIGATAGAQNPAKINLSGLSLIESYKAGAVLPEGVAASPLSRGGAPTVDVLVETSSQAVLDSLASEGYAVEYISRSFSLVSMPIDKIENLSESSAVRTLSFGDRADVKMDRARQAGYVHTCHSGLGINFNGERNVPFYGEGVIVGAFDSGFDPSHVNFYSIDQSESRLKYYARFIGSSVVPTVYTGDNTVTAPTDKQSQTDATHVVGICAV